MRQWPLKRVLAVAAALAFLVTALGSDTRYASAGEMKRRGGGDGGSGVGVGVGIGVGTILLNEAIRRQQQKKQQQNVTRPKGCPEGLVYKKKKGCVKPEPQVTKCEPPKIKTRKGCVYPAPETASCEWPMVKSGKGCDCAAGYTRQQGECVKKDDQQVADCEWPMVKSGKGCDCASGYTRQHGECVKKDDQEVADCDWPEVKAGRGCDCAAGYRRHDGECVKKEEVADCRWPLIKLGKGCICAPGLIPANGTCIQPPTVVVDPGDDGPPGIGPADDEEPPRGGPPPPIQAEEPKPKPKSKAVAAISPAQIRCLPQDLYDLMVEAYGKRPAVGPCPTACLPKPAYFSTPKLDAIAAKSGITWCENCVQVGPYMPLASLLKLEALAHVTICVAPDSCVYPGTYPGGAAEPRVEIRTVFKDLPAGVKNEGNLAVVVGNQTYLGELPVNAYGASDADAVTALLIDQLGYRKENIIDLRDASLADFERVFGSDANPGGEIAKRIDKKDPGDVFIYVASHGMTNEDDGKQVYLLPVDAKLGKLDETAYPLQELYDNLGKTGARTTMLVLESNFAKNLDELIDPPNLPALEVEAMPATPVPGLAVFKASDRDQRTIQDPEYGIGLFTRYLIEGLAGRADEAPLGNGDKRIDTVELYVYTSDMVRTAARKSFGLEQKPMLSKIDNLVVGNLAAR